MTAYKPKDERAVMSFLYLGKVKVLAEQEECGVSQSRSDHAMQQGKAFLS
jgi:hypothetical protein